MDLVATTAYLVIYSISLLVLISLGLAVIFGMMKVINLAHGEFMMLGAYVCVLADNAGIPLWVAMAGSAVLVGAFGLLVERLVIRRLYGRIIDTLLATWGLSLFLVGGVTTVFGPQGRSLSTSFGNVSFAGENLSTYNLLLIAVTAAVAALTWALARFTKFGLIVRGAMQDPEMAQSRLHGDLRVRRGACRVCRRHARAHHRGRADDGRVLRREGLHHGHSRRPFASDGDAGRVGPLRRD